MKINKKTQHQQRQILDLKIKDLSSRPSLKKGWIKTVRSALGISTRQLAELMGVTVNTITKLEIGESKKTASLQSLIKAAEAMECELVYLVAPKAPFKTFEELIEQKALALAHKIANGVPHSMNLELQKVEESITQNQIKNLAQELKKDLDPRLWKKTKSNV